MIMKVYQFIMARCSSSGGAGEHETIDPGSISSISEVL